MRNWFGGSGDAGKVADRDSNVVAINTDAAAIGAAVRPIRLEAPDAEQEVRDAVPRRRWYEIEISQWAELNLPLSGVGVVEDAHVAALLNANGAGEEVVVLEGQGNEVWLLVTKPYLDAHHSEINTVQTLLEAQRKKVLRKRVTGSVISYARAHLMGDAKVDGGQALSSPWEDSSALREFEDIVREAIKRGTSDIHISAKETETVVKYRIEGHVTVSERPLTLNRAKDIASAVYNALPDKGSNTGSMLSFETQQRAAIPLTIELEGKKERIKLRFQISPKLGGFHATMRVLFEDSERFAAGDSLEEDLEGLGYLPDQAARIAMATRKSNGSIAVAGATGSGKTVSLYTMLTHMATPDKMTFTVEDPIEGALEGVEQIQVNVTADMTPDQAISEIVKALMRMDPDIALVSEIRGRETASGYQELTQTGHKTLTTIHADSGLDIFERMASEQIGIPRNVLTGPGFFSLLMYQRLLRQMCEHCRIPLVESPAASKAEFISQLGIDPKGVYITNYEGCEHCKENPVPGVARRTVCAELVMPDFELLQLVKKEQLLEAFLYWRKNKAGLESPDSRGKTSYEVALYKMAQGLIDPSEVEEIEPFALYMERNING